MALLWPKASGKFYGNSTIVDGRTLNDKKFVTNPPIPLNIKFIIFTIMHFRQKDTFCHYSSNQVSITVLYCICTFIQFSSFHNTFYERTKPFSCVLSYIMHSLDFWFDGKTSFYFILCGALSLNVDNRCHHGCWHLVLRSNIVCYKGKSHVTHACYMHVSR